MATTVAPRETRGSSSWLRPRTILHEMEDLLSEFAGTEPESWFTGRLVPSLDVSESPEAVEVKMDLPGIKPEEIDIRVNGNLLTISGERKEEKETKDKSFHRIERRMGSFSRSVTLPSRIVEDKIDAKYEGGVLKVVMPKAEEAKARKIAVTG